MEGSSYTIFATFRNPGFRNARTLLARLSPDDVAVPSVRSWPINIAHGWSYTRPGWGLCLGTSAKGSGGNGGYYKGIKEERC